jgi:hypothetical protein
LGSPLNLTFLVSQSWSSFTSSSPGSSLYFFWRRSSPVPPAAPLPITRPHDRNFQSYLRGMVSGGEGSGSRRGRSSAPFARSTPSVSRPLGAGDSPEDAQGVCCYCLGEVVDSAASAPQGEARRAGAFVAGGENCTFPPWICPRRSRGLEEQGRLAMMVVGGGGSCSSGGALWLFLCSGSFCACVVDLY